MIGSSPAQASTEPFWSAAQPSACWRTSTVTSDGFNPAVSSAWSRKKYGSVPLVAAIFLPLRSATEVIGDPFGTTMAAHSGCEKMSMTWIGEPLERARSAAEPAVEPTSIASARRASLALFEPADLTQLTVTFWAARPDSSQPWSLMTRLSGL